MESGRMQGLFKATSSAALACKFLTQSGPDQRSHKAAFYRLYPAQRPINGQPNFMNLTFTVQLSPKVRLWARWGCCKSPLKEGHTFKKKRQLQSLFNVHALVPQNKRYLFLRLLLRIEINLVTVSKYC